MSILLNNNSKTLNGVGLNIQGLHPNGMQGALTRGIQSKTNSLLNQNNNHTSSSLNVDPHHSSYTSVSHANPDLTSKVSGSNTALNSILGQAANKFGKSVKMVNRIKSKLGQQHRHQMAHDKEELTFIFNTKSF